MFERNATARGATVLWAETPDEVNKHVLDIAKRHGVHKTIKSKSMVSEESALDRAIEASGARAQVEEMIDLRLADARDALAALALDTEGEVFFSGLLDHLRGRET